MDKQGFKVDTAMRTAFAKAHNIAAGSKLKRMVRVALCSSRGVIFVKRGWRVIRSGT